MRGFLTKPIRHSRASGNPVASDSERMRFLSRRRAPLDSRFRGNDVVRFVFVVAILCLTSIAAHAADSPKIDSALCRNLVAYTEPPGVAYQPGVDVDGHYMAPADVAGSASPTLPKKINIPLTLSLAKTLNLDTSQYPYDQLGPSTEVPVGTISVEGNHVTLNGKSLSDTQQDKLAALCAKQSP